MLITEIWRIFLKIKMTGGPFLDFWDLCDASNAIYFDFLNTKLSFFFPLLIWRLFTRYTFTFFML